MFFDQPIQIELRNAEVISERFQHIEKRLCRLSHVLLGVFLLRVCPVLAGTIDLRRYKIAISRFSNANPGRRAHFIDWMQPRPSWLRRKGPKRPPNGFIGQTVGTPSNLHDFARTIHKRIGRSLRCAIRDSVLDTELAESPKGEVHLYFTSDQPLRTERKDIRHD